MSDLFPPFAPDPDEPRKRLFKPVPFRVIVPNIITLIALCLGLTAIRLAFEGKFEPAVIAIVAAAVLDGVDGRIARLLKGTSRFGAELDSLADFVNFGVTPALILYSFILNELKALGWIAVLVFAIAMVLRLARFNVMLDDPNRPEWQKNFFTGMPAPAGAVTSLLPLYLSFLGVPMEAAAAPVVLVYLLGLAFLMVSTIPVYSGKTLGKSVPRHWVLPIFVLSVAGFGLLVSFPFEVLTGITLIFLGTIPLGVMKYRRLEREHAARLPEPVVPPPHM
ncbi:CDP-diacylglycerol--serine O-phosphatidyltransferase [Microvirga antarctica]|uniref:CDP-diacylglycerol--serine O-phosphatidyltransferase n=1 Tax=Microvirga antarctica TaxID=2819233 RepID=UPI001B3147B3|nr:CDP-diacylglycerol--serine O-phosphatidyltransferase [Microvirga antarctica]